MLLGSLSVRHLGVRTQARDIIAEFKIGVRVVRLHLCYGLCRTLWARPLGCDNVGAFKGLACDEHGESEQGRSNTLSSMLWDASTSSAFCSSPFFLGALASSLAGSEEWYWMLFDPPLR